MLLAASLAIAEPTAMATPPPQHCVAGTDGNGCLPEGGGGGFSDANIVNYVLDGSTDWDGWSWGVFYRSDGVSPSWIDVINLRAEEPAFVKCTLGYRGNAKDPENIFCR